MVEIHPPAVSGPRSARWAPTVACHCNFEPSEGMLLYFGPEVLMPVVSAVAAALGAILIGGKRVLGWIGSALRRVGTLVGISTAEDAEEVEVDADHAGDAASPSPADAAGTEEDR